MIFEDERYDYAFAVWGNSTLGLLSYWWHSNRQQPGRGIITIRTAETLPILDLRALSDAQLATARGDIRGVSWAGAEAGVSGG